LSFFGAWQLMRFAFFASALTDGGSNILQFFNGQHIFG
jgi:hypothetical protein